MLIDWFTVVAQALNFLILVWLMRRFLYQPILRAIDEREKRIADELADADAKKAEAKAERDEFQQKNEAFDRERAGLVDEATREAHEQGRQLIADARNAADDSSKKREKAMQEEAGKLGKTLARRTQDEVFAVARKVLSDLASTSLEEQICEVFTRRLGELDKEAKSDLGKALKNSSEPILVRSAFALSSDQSATIGKALNKIFSGDISLRFETVPDLISGIELSTVGQKVGWNIADYLASVEKAAREVLAKKVRTEPEAGVVPESKSESKSKSEAVIP